MNKKNKNDFKSLIFNPQFLICASLLILFIVCPSLAISKDLDQAIVHYNQGYDYYKKGEYDKAIEELGNSLKIDSDNENAHYGMGNCYYRKQIYEKAVDSYLESIKINPDFANAHYGLGTAYSALRKTDEADKEFSLYRELKTGQAKPKGEVAVKEEKSSKRSSSKKSAKKKTSSIKSRKSKSESKSRSKSKTSFKGLSPKKDLKKILTIPKLRSAREYFGRFKEVWSGSYVGKILIGIICYIGVTQVWLLLIAFQGVVLWGIKKGVSKSGKPGC